MPPSTPLLLHALPQYGSGTETSGAVRLGEGFDRASVRGKHVIVVGVRRGCVGPVFVYISSCPCMCVGVAGVEGKWVRGTGRGARGGRLGQGLARMQGGCREGRSEHMASQAVLGRWGRCG